METLQLQTSQKLSPLQLELLKNFPLIQLKMS